MFFERRMLIWMGYTKHSNWVYSLAWPLPDCLRLASGGYDNTVQVWQALNQPAAAERLDLQSASYRQLNPYFFDRS